jgi:O-methyltransferase
VGDPVNRLAKLICNPKKYLPISRRVALLPLCRVFRNTGFYLQSQMDIHHLSRWHTDFASVTGGFYPTADRDGREICGLDDYDSVRRDMLVLLIRTVIANGVVGAFAELGVYKGHTARLIHYYAPERWLHLFDTFEGFTERSAAAETRATAFVVAPTHFADTSLEAVRSYLRPRSDRLVFHKGYFPDTISAELSSERFAFVHLDADLYEPITEGLRFFYPRMTRKGVIVVHDYNAWLGARKAVDEFFAGKDELPIPMPDKSGSAVIIKQ